MNNRHLIAVFLVVFVVTVYLGSRRDGKPSAHGPMPSSTVDMNAGTAGAGQSPAAGESAPADVLSVAHPRNSPLSPDQLVIADDAPYPADDSASPTSLDPAKSEVPVLLSVDSTSGATRHTASLRNVGSELLNVKVTAINPPSGRRSIVQVAIPPRAELNLTDAGLVVATGAEISIESPPYLAQTSTVY
jgi:hypothetical protein